ncbi:MAG: iron-containing alcohol dehydrogenase [Enterobacterales bacterium]|nr:iron-containing alcohol dehydrogenase [Enterobacterales bacterium]
MTLSANWNYPTQMRVGAGRVKEIAKLCNSMSIQAPLIVTDPGIAALPMLAEIKQYLSDAGCDASVFSEVKANPNGENVMAGVACYHQQKNDGVIALGGGSALDAAKAIALMVGQKGVLWDYEDVGSNWKAVNSDSMAPVIAIPTTAGTGSEVGRASVITDSQKKLKKIIFHPNMLPAQVILDPLLTCGLPAHLTAATGMDALSHNLEALCSPFYHPMAEGIAMQGIALIKQYLPIAVADGSNLEARTQMLVASTMGATAFQKGLGGMHAIAHSLGALYDAHHGLLNAILMPYVLKTNQNAIEDKIQSLASYLQLEDGNFNGFLNWILKLRQDLKIPHSLAEINIDQKDALKIGQMAIADATAAGNPIQFSAAQYQKIFEKAVDGEV